MIIFDKYDNDLLFEDLEMLENMIDLSYEKIITVNEIHEIGLEFILFFMKYTNDKEQFG